MKYKTLFRLAVKFLGLWVIVIGGAEGVLYLAQIAMALMNQQSMGMWQWMVPMALSPILKVGLGLYLFTRGEWIVNLAIPSNRAYCPHCGYDLQGRDGGRHCPECGVGLPAEW
jgi:hypothetical protein